MNQLQDNVADLMADTNDRIGKTRRPLFRIYEIHAAIRGGSYPNCNQLAKRLGVQRKTIGEIFLSVKLLKSQQAG